MSKTAAVGLPTWRGAATHVDLAQSTGPTHDWRRWRRDRALAGVVVDLNSIPALHHHLHVANPGSTSRVAVPILRALLDGGRP